MGIPEVCSALRQYFKDFIKYTKRKIHPLPNLPEENAAAYNKNDLDEILGIKEDVPPSSNRNWHTPPLTAGYTLPGSANCILNPPSSAATIPVRWTTTSSSLTAVKSRKKKKKTLDEILGIKKKQQIPQDTSSYVPPSKAGWYPPIKLTQIFYEPVSLKKKTLDEILGL